MDNIIINNKELDIIETIDRIKDYNELNYQEDAENKVFYNWYEWNGWRFYFKALWNFDFKSIAGHLKTPLLDRRKYFRLQKRAFKSYKNLINQKR